MSPTWLEEINVRKLITIYYIFKHRPYNKSHTVLKAWSVQVCFVPTSHTNLNIKPVLCTDMENPAKFSKEMSNDVHFFLLR